MFVMDEPIINESSFSTANPSSYDTTLGLKIGGDFSHDLARREKINERMKILQDLVPGCNKGIGKALIVDQIINYTQSLQHQVEFLSMKLEAVNTRMSSPIEGFPTKESNLNGKRMKISGLKDELSGLGVNGEGSSGSGSKVAAAEQSSKQTESPKDYIHVRARRNQATDSPSLAERARREMINARMKIIQDLVPGCNKGIGKVLMLDEVINYIQSLQHQVEFLSMKLEAGNTRMSSPIEGFPTKEQKKQDYGCGKFIWKDDLDLQLRIRSSSGYSTPQGSPSRRSIHPSSSTGSSESATTECSNCKIKDLKIKMLEARLEMERHPEDHACQSAAILHELLNEMENLSVE